jgi:V-type H+-transporting ATPase subunit a
MNGSYANLEKRALELEEARQVLRETDVFFKNASTRTDRIRSSFDEPNAPLLGDVEDMSAGEGGSGHFDLE